MSCKQAPWIALETFKNKNELSLQTIKYRKCTKVTLCQRQAKIVFRDKEMKYGHKEMKYEHPKLRCMLPCRHI